MVDISDKPEVFREATATGTIRLKSNTIRLINEGKVEKGDPLYTAKVAGILAAKETGALIPFCHPLPLTKVDVKIAILNKSTVQVISNVKTKAQTGVEMEALVATTISLLTIWDMVKQYEKDATGQYPATCIEKVRVVKKIKEGSSVERKRKKA
ncbi:MAG: cyclic pyranopterin monophosphate synthase MoaC [Candidatus Bathyarchaeota archaeon]|nr:cyclic pyranopterin monophosphate synthase MoaC [Candidatus Bathyarchaeota archaeon]MDH5787461.1 cyclic pyranopterin monophosphate synthase MoaC [Candidatus Bathyarchaeota archaeon]